MQILIPVDDMPYTLASLYSVKQRQWPEGTRIVLGRVIEDCSGYGGGEITSVSSELNRLDSDTYYHLQKAEKWLEGLANSLKIENCEINTALLIGDVADQLASLANDYSIDYIIIGSHERAPAVRDWLVSIASSITDKVSCSVEIVRPRALHKMLKQQQTDDDEIARIDYSPGKIVLALDFSDNSLAALDWLCQIGCAPGTQVALIAVEPPVSKGLVDLKLAGKLDGSRTTQLKVEDIAHRLKEESNKLKDRLHAAVTDTKVLKGDPAEKILEYARSWQADLIVVGAHGVTSSYELMMGSTTRSVIDGSDCSVVSINAKNWSTITFDWTPART
ncbi:MAG: universal stress protein [Candidatus Melainabacteria bacterium]|nr:universal stress protein [Candidatus Melainabacteria bacterium]